MLGWGLEEAFRNTSAPLFLPPEFQEGSMLMYKCCSPLAGCY